MNYVKKYWIGIGSILLIGIFGFFLYESFLGYYSYPSEGIAETAGKSIAYSTIGFFVLNSTRKKLAKGKFEWWLSCTAISFSLCAIYDASQAVKKSQQLNNFKQEASRLFDPTSRSLSQDSMDYTESEYGDLAEVLHVYNRISKFSENTITAINAACANLEGSLQPAYLCERGNIERAKTQVSDFINVLDEYENKYAIELALVEPEIQNSKMKSNLKKSFLEGFKKGQKRSMFPEYFRIERESAEKLDNILDFLSTKTFKVVNGKLVFQKGADVETYNALIQDLTAHAEKEAEIVAQIETQVQSAHDEMRNL